MIRSTTSQARAELHLSEHSLSSGFGQDVHGERIAVVVESFLEARLVVDEIGLSPRPEKRGAVNMTDVFHHHTRFPPCIVEKSLRRAKKDCT